MTQIFRHWELAGSLVHGNLHECVQIGYIDLRKSMAQSISTSKSILAFPSEYQSKSSIRTSEESRQGGEVKKFRPFRRSPAVDFTIDHSQASTLHRQRHASSLRKWFASIELIDYRPADKLDSVATRIHKPTGTTALPENRTSIGSFLRQLFFQSS